MTCTRDRLPKSPARPSQLAADVPLHTRDVFRRRPIGFVQKLLGQAYGAQRQAHRLDDASAVRQRDLTRAAAKIDQQAAALRPRFAHYAAMDEPRLFESGDDLQVPSRLGLDPGDKCLSVPCIAQRGGGNRAHTVRGCLLHCLVETFEGAQGAGHRIGRDHSALEDAGAEARHFAIFVENFQPVLFDAGDLEPAGIRSDVDRSEGLHSLHGS